MTGERKQTSFRLNTDVLDELDTEAENRNLTRSEYLRQIVRERHRADSLADKCDTLRTELNRREDRVSELEDQLRKRSRVEEKVDEMALQLRESDTEPPFFIKWWNWYKKQ